MDRGDAVARFAYEIPSLDSYWRAIILFGQNVASYKFALAGALLELGAGPETVGLDELAVPFASRVAEHLRTHDKQGTFERSRFLDACRAFNRGELDDDGLRAKTVQLGFDNVIDAFHVVDRSEVAEPVLHRRASRAGRASDSPISSDRSSDDGQAGNLGEELEARWRLVETAWELNLPRHLLTVEYEPVNHDARRAETAHGHHRRARRAERLPEGPLLLLLRAGLESSAESHRHARSTTSSPGRPGRRSAARRSMASGTSFWRAPAATAGTRSRTARPTSTRARATRCTAAADQSASSAPPASACWPPPTPTTTTCASSHRSRTTSHPPRRHSPTGSCPMATSSTWPASNGTVKANTTPAHSSPTTTTPVASPRQSNGSRTISNNKDRHRRRTRRRSLERRTNQRADVTTRSKQAPRVGRVEGIPPLRVGHHQVRSYLCRSGTVSAKTPWKRIQSQYRAPALAQVRPGFHRAFTVSAQ